MVAGSSNNSNLRYVRATLTSLVFGLMAYFHKFSKQAPSPENTQVTGPCSPGDEPKRSASHPLVKHPLLSHADPLQSPVPPG